MKRHIALQNISREHQQTLSLSQQIIRAAKENDLELLGSLAQKAHDFSNAVLKPHFAKEEATFFHILHNSYPEHKSLVKTYLDEHKELINIGSELSNNASTKQLETFAHLLKSHTRKEERELFPLIENCFTEQQLKATEEGTAITADAD